MRFRRMPPVAAWVLAALLVPVLCSAQASSAGHGSPSWARDVAGLSVNSLVGGLSAGLAQSARGGSFRDGFTRGAAGGAGVYAGKRIAVERWPGAGLLGRQVASVGASVVWNAGSGRPSLEQVALPAGPVRFYVRTSGTGPRVQARVDALSLAATAYALTRPELAWDAERSLSSGTMVFLARDHSMRLAGEHAAAVAYPGTVVLGAVRATDAYSLAEYFAHERIHVIQADQMFLGVGRPLQEAAAARVPGGRAFSRWVDVDVTAAVLAGLASLLPIQPHERPWEVEAIYMAPR